MLAVYRNCSLVKVNDSIVYSDEARRMWFLLIVVAAYLLVRGLRSGLLRQQVRLPLFHSP